MQCLKRIRYRAGRCYELAYRVMLDEPGAQAFTLVHGWISQVKGCNDTLIGHAWIELDDGRVYDPVMNKYFLPGEYARARCVAVDKRYSHPEAMVMAAHGHFGPWAGLPEFAIGLEQRG